MAGRRGVHVSSMRAGDRDRRRRRGGLRDELLDHLRLDDELEIAESRAEGDQQHEDGGENDAALQDLTQTGSGTDKMEMAKHRRQHKILFRDKSSRDLVLNIFWLVNTHLFVTQREFALCEIAHSMASFLRRAIRPGVSRARHIS